MFFEREYVSPRRIILEAIAGKVSRDTFRKVLREENIDEIEDLSSILTKAEYDVVSKCIRDAFARQTIWYLAVFSCIMGKNRCCLECEEFDIDI